MIQLDGSHIFSNGLVQPPTREPCEQKRSPTHHQTKNHCQPFWGALNLLYHVRSVCFFSCYFGSRSTQIHLDPSPGFFRIPQIQKGMLGGRLSPQKLFFFLGGGTSNYFCLCSNFELPGVSMMIPKLTQIRIIFCRWVGLKPPSGCFRKWWYPQIIHFNRVFHYTPSILGYHYFWKRPSRFKKVNLLELWRRKPPQRAFFKNRGVDGFRFDLMGHLTLKCLQQLGGQTGWREILGGKKRVVSGFVGGFWGWRWFLG